MRTAGPSEPAIGAAGASPAMPEGRRQSGRPRQILGFLPFSNEGARRAARWSEAGLDAVALAFLPLLVVLPPTETTSCVGPTATLPTTSRDNRSVPNEALAPTCAP